MSNPSDQNAAIPERSDDAERLFTELFNLSPFPAVVSRISDSTVVAVNARTAALLRRSPEEAIGLKVTDYYVNPADRALIHERIQRDGRADNVRIQVRRRSPGPFWALASAQRVMWHGEPAVLTVFHDITDQVEAEAALKANEQRLAKQSDALTFLTSRYTDPEGDVIDRLRTILAVAAQALSVDRLSLWRFDGQRSAIRCLGLYLRSETRYESGAVLSRDLAPAYFAAIEHERVVAANDAQSDERTRDFKDVYLAPLGIGAMLDVPLRQENTSIGVLCAEHVGAARHWTVDEQNFAISVANLVVVALAEDERRHALTRLAESEARARLIIDTAHDAFIGIDSAGRIAAWNAQAERTFGWTREEVMGRNLAETIVPPGFRDAHTKGLRRFHQTGEAPVVNQRLELSACHRDGHEFPVELTISSPMRAESGYFFGAFLRDISERRQRVDELRHAKETAEAATRAKSEFLANMSHELRTPLNGVIGYAQLLQRDRTLNTSQQEALDAISKCGSQLLDLINDVLDLSKIEAGRLDIEEAPTDLTKLVVDLRYVLADAVERKGLKLTLAVDEDVPRSVVLDGRHLRQVLLNLLGNAVKFTPAGEVRLVIGRAEGWRLRFTVHDTGIGIEREALTEIFEAFTQTKAGAAAGGTGLGLTISAHLVKKMGDALRVESVPGEGSAFSFTLPLVEGAWTGIDPTEAEMGRHPVPCEARTGRRADGARRRRQRREPAHPGEPARKRRCPRDYRQWRH
jgi:PAS domain S-box-containing protein